MGINEAAILNQAKKGQGETNQRLEALIAEQRLTNQLLERIAVALEAQLQPRPPYPPAPVQPPYPQLGRR